MSAKKEKKENKATKATPKWGTKEWIVAYPWSEMGKDRRRRVRQVLKDADKSLFEPVGLAVDDIDCLCKKLAKAKISIEKGLVKEVRAAAAKADSFRLCARDALISQALDRRWRKEKSCAGCSDAKPGTKPCTKPCKQADKKPAKGKK